MLAKGADFSRCNLTSARFVNADLSGGKLSGAILSGADLSGATLSGATFDGADLYNAKLSEVNLVGVDFGGVDLTTTIFDPNPVFSTDPKHLTKFVGSRVRLATLGKNWSYLDLTGATIVGLEKSSDLSGLQARYAVLAGIDLSGCKLAGACLNNANLSGATLSGATLSDAKFQSATLLAARLVGTNLTHADLSGAQLGGQPGSLAANLSYAFMRGAILDKANLYGVEFSYATIIGASFQNTTSLQQTSFTNAYVENVDLSGIAPDLRGANLVGACLINCQFNGADMTPAAGGSISTKLMDACVQGAQFTGARLAGANLTNAAVASARGEVNTSYCQSDGTVSAAFPMAFQATTGLDLTTLQADTICPNGNTVATNTAHRLQLGQMLKADNAPTEWKPQSCERSAARA